MRKFFVVAAASATLLAGAACSTLGRAAFKEPKVELQDVKITGIGLNGGSLDVLLNVDNPNEFRLDATRLTYNVLVGDSIRFATGTVSNHFTVDGKKSQQVHIPVNFTYAGIGAAGRQLMQSGAVDYKVVGDVTVGSPIGSFTVPYSSTGRYTTLGGSVRQH
jgi:LEA14-like dessication related protein